MRWIEEKSWGKGQTRQREIRRKTQKVRVQSTIKHFRKRSVGNESYSSNLEEWRGVV
jgi:hypothetical protein